MKEASVRDLPELYQTHAALKAEVERLEKQKATLEMGSEGQISKHQPRHLMNKFSHLMKDTKSSINRTANLKPSPKKNERPKVSMPQFASNQSPKKAPKSPKGKSPSQKVQFADKDNQNIINLRSTPT